MKESRNILILCSSAEERAKMKGMLSGDSGGNYKFLEVEPGFEGLDVFGSEAGTSPDCLLLDELLSEMNPLEVLGTLRKGSKSPTCPVVVVTMPGNNNGVEFLRAGAQDTIGADWMTAESLNRSVGNAIERAALNGNGPPGERESAKDGPFLKRVLDNLFAFVGVLSPNGKVIEVNEAPLEVAGISADEVIGKQFWHCYWWNFTPESQADLRRDIELAAAGETVRRDCEVRVAGGKLLWIDFQLSPMRDNNGRITHLIPSGMDISERKRVEMELRRKKDELATFFEDASIGLHWVGPDGIIQWANRAELEMLGYAEEDYIGRNIAEFHVDEEVINDILERLTRGERLYELEARLRHRDGSIRYVTINSSVFKEGDEEKFRHTQCFTTDITERRSAAEALRESEQKLRAIYDGTHDYIGLLTPDGTLIQANQASLDFDGSQPGDVLGRPFWESAWFKFTPWAPDAVKAAVAKASAGEFVRFEADIYSREGEERTFDISLAPIRSEDGKVIYIVPEGRDITARKQAEEARGESERRLRETIDALPAAIYTTDASGHLTYFNPASVKFSGREPELGTDQWCVTWKLYYPDGRPMPHDECPMANALKSGVASSGHEAIAERPDGTRIWFEPYPTPLRDAAGNVNGGVNMLVDITERKRAEEALRESEERYRGTFESAAIGIANIGLDGRWLRVNQAICDMTGYSREELLALAFRDISHPDDVEAGLFLLDSLRDGEMQKHSVEKRYIRKNGSTMWANLTVSVLSDISGKPVHIIAAIEDISEKKQALIELERQRKFVERLTSVMPSVLYVFNLIKQRNTWVNREIAEAMGYSGEEAAAMGSKIFETLLHPEDLPLIQVHLDELAAAPDGKIFFVEYRMRNREGEWRWIQSHATTFTRDEKGKVVEIIGTASDITSQMNAQESIRESEERLALGVQVAGLALAEVYYETNTIRLTAEAAQMFGIDAVAVEVPRERYHATFHPEDHARLMDRIEDSLDPGGSGWFALDHRIILPGGEIRWLRIRKQVFFETGTGGRRPVRAALAALDVTAEKQAAESIVASEERFRQLFEHAATGIAITDTEGKLARCNPAYCKLVGYTEEELREIVFSELIHPDDREENLASIRRIQDEELPHFEIENRYVRKGGEAVWVRKFVSRMRGESNEAGNLVALVSDVTERRRREAELHEEAKRKDEFLAMLGHELRNPLAAIRQAVCVDSEAQENAEDQTWAREVIDRQSKQLSRMVDDLLDVARITRGRIELRTEPLNLSEVLARSIAITRPNMEQQKQSLTCETPEEPLYVRGDAVRLEQVFGNLLNNASKYTPEGGKISVSARRADGEALVSIKDNGVGIAADLLPQLFDLFRQAQTSIDRSQGGLGIGLTVVKSLIELHGGTVLAESKGEQCGSTFTVCLPLNKGEPEQAETPPETPATDSGQWRSLRVLIVDDRRDAAFGLARLLGRRNYEVRVSHDGKDALAVADEFLPEIFLLDLGLPGLDGYEVARALRADERFKSAFLVAISGYAQASDLTQSKAAGFDHHFAKPIDIAPLLAVMRGVAAGD